MSLVEDIGFFGFLFIVGFVLNFTLSSDFPFSFSWSKGVRPYFLHKKNTNFDPDIVL